MESFGLPAAMPPEVSPPPRALRTLFVIAFISLIVLLVGGGYLLVRWHDGYQGRVFPGVQLGDVPIGGMNKMELTQLLDVMADKLSNEGVTVSAARIDGKTETFTLNTAPSLGSDPTVLFDIDTALESKRLLSYGRGRRLGEIAFMLRAAWFKPQMSLAHLKVNHPQIEQLMKDHIDGKRTVPTDAHLRISSISPLAYDVTAPKRGTIFLYREAIADMVREWSNLRSPVVTLVEKEVNPDILSADVQSVAQSLPLALAMGPWAMQYTAATTNTSFHGTITPSTWASWLVVVRNSDGAPRLGIDPGLADAFLNKHVASYIDVGADNARFRIGKDGKVSEFQSAKRGQALDRPAVVSLLDDMVVRASRGESVSTTIALPVVPVEPDVATESVNSLGITTLLGSGMSNFAGSPKNRILNIKNAVKKLHGLLIKPGEEFSTIKYTGPYTPEEGWLPELVIKGDRIKPELGGGLCQVGSTLFRMAMNSGLPITERQNHSLAISYYNDPASGLPGVDATIYDPLPDFKFINDTPNYILIQADVDTKTGKLTFSLWGTSDGRKGSYASPKVSKWYPPGDTKEIESADLFVGERKCQHSYRGADASFTYTRELPDGTKEDRLFSSHYRALPEICLIGTKPQPETPSSTPEIILQ